MIERFGSEAPWESVVGYSRAVLAGPWLEVSGTTAIRDGELVCPGDPYGQARQALVNIEAALRLAGARLSDVVRTRMYVTDITRWPEVARAHAEFFADIRPATSMVEVASLLDPLMEVEVEASAYVAERAS
ncbi:MAG: RidA family protein [Frankiaceae bacterium]